MSHEIRTPIGAVLGFTELLLNGDAPLLPEQKSHLQRVLSNGNHLHRLLNDLLDLSRIEAGALTIESMECAPYPMFHDILSALQSRAIAKNLKLTLKLANGIPEKILTDPTRLRQILTNLIGNAVKFTNEGSVSLIVQTDVERCRLRIQVQDTGVGISASARKDIFEPFRQADETVTRRFGGTGLGLSISRSLARALGGDIEVSSEPGFGSTFSVTIATGPLEGMKILNARQAEATPAAPIAEAGPALNLNGYRILITDDVEANREFFAHVLRRANAECLFACNGQEAIAIMQHDSCDLILMDIQMPVLDGYAATKMLRDAGVRIPIVAITANGTEDDKQRCRDTGFTGYLTKPISIASLLRGVGDPLGVVAEQIQFSGQAATPVPPTRETSKSVDNSRKNGINRTSLALPVDPVFRDFATRFVRKVKDALPEIMSAIADSNCTTLSGLAHWIKGTGGTVGLPGLTDIGKELHALAHAEDYAGARIIALELQTIIETLQRESQCEHAVQ